MSRSPGSSDDYARVERLIETDPQRAWIALLEFLSSDPSPSEASSLTEYFLDLHLADFIDEIERVVLTNKRLAEEIANTTAFGGAGSAMDRLVDLWAKLRQQNDEERSGGASAPVVDRSQSRSEREQPPRDAAKLERGAELTSEWLRSVDAVSDAPRADHPPGRQAAWTAPDGAAATWPVATVRFTVVNNDHEAELYRFLVDPATTEVLVRLLQTAMRAGFGDAFVVVFLGVHRGSVDVIVVIGTAIGPITSRDALLERLRQGIPEMTDALRQYVSDRYAGTDVEAEIVSIDV